MESNLKKGGKNSGKNSGKKVGKRGRPKSAILYCEKCNYQARDNYDWKRHIKTKKHLKEPKKDESKLLCEKCGKSYKYRHSLDKHRERCCLVKKKTKSKKNKNENKTKMDSEKEILKSEVKELKYMITNLIENQQQNNKNFTETLSKIIPKIGNKFYQSMNVNIFLNENCKNAMNISDFIDKITVTLEDLDYTKNHGFVEGISNIFMKKLKDLKPTERPIHCGDKDKLDFYVKNKDEWQVDEKHEMIDSSIYAITNKQIKNIKKWEKENPNYLTDEKLLNEWNGMIHGVMGEIDKNDSLNSIKKNLGTNTEMNEELLSLTDNNTLKIS